jgi:RHS repeat-associated protein
MNHEPFGDAPFDSTQLGTLPEKHQFTSYERDYESDTDYAVNRQYHTANGRFMQPDPIAGSLGDPQSLNRYTYVLNDPVNLNDPTGLYRGCIHQAMTEYLARLAGKNDSIAAQLGKFAGDGSGGADSWEFSALNPANWGPGGTFSGIHFASDERLAELETSFSLDLLNNDFESAGHTLHAIEDSHGAHKNYRGFWKWTRLGHAFPDIGQWLGVWHSPDNVIGDEKFVNVANEVYQLLTGDSSKRLTADQMNGLIDAIIAGCGAKKSIFNTKQCQSNNCPQQWA